MAEGEEFAELAETNLNHHHLHQYGGGHGGHGSRGVHGMQQMHRHGGGGGGGSGSWGHGLGPQGTSYEAEDIMRSSRHGGGQGGGGGGHGGRGMGMGSGAFYSPPGTSYTIVERPSSAPRGTYLGGGQGGGGGSGANSPPTSRHAHQTHQAHHGNKKRPLSPEEVLKLMGVGGLAGAKGRDAPASDPPRRRPPPAASPPLSELAVRTVTMVRANDTPQPNHGPGHGFGICVKGGAKDTAIDWDRRDGRSDPTTPFHFPSPGSSTGVYISRVEEGSVAQRAGLRPGDVILEVNGTPFSGLSHEDALKMLKSCRKMTMTVRAAPAPPVSQTGHHPSLAAQAAWAARQAYSWMDRSGRPVSPPPPLPSPHSLHSPSRWAHARTRKVDLSIEPGQSLGLMIRGGIEYNLGVFITGVDKDSVADRAGLMIGDQILEVNGQSFLDVTHDEAVTQLKLHKRMTLTVRDVGKVPHSCTDPPQRPWDSPGGFLGGSGRSPALQMVEEKARVVLSKSEFATLAYYQEEYAGGQMTIEAFVAVLLELLNTPEKYTLLTELREVVVNEDRPRFDELVYRREVESRRIRDITREYGSLDGEKLRGRRHSSPENSLSGSITRLQDDSFDDSRMLPHKMGRSFDMKDDQELLETEHGMRRHHSMQRLGLGRQDDASREAEAAMVVADQLGNLRITVRKNKPLLGIAIEGGANTRHPLPRIINIHEHGAAYEAGGLEVGQLILEVDGHRVESMHHQDVARMIAESFARRDRSEIEFLVIEAKKSNLEPKPTALIFLEG